jgi:riboflavin kinase/FMN adenylyltransferase
VTGALPGGAGGARRSPNVGRRPTLGGDPETRLETHLFDFAGDLYGQVIGVRLRHFLRADARFEGLEALKAAIAEDAAQARRILGI